MRYAALVDDRRGASVFLRTDRPTADAFAELVGMPSPYWSSAGRGFMFPRGATPDLMAAASVLRVSVREVSNRAVSP